MAPTLVTTDKTLPRDLRASLNRQEGIPCGLTWGDFMAAMTLLGIKPTDRLASIEYGCARLGTGRLVAHEAEDGIEIQERHL